MSSVIDELKSVCGYQPGGNSVRRLSYIDSDKVIKLIAAYEAVKAERDEWREFCGRSSGPVWQAVFQDEDGRYYENIKASTAADRAVRELEGE